MSGPEYRTQNFVEMSLILQCQKIAQGIRIRLENHFFPLETAKKTILLERKPLKNQKIAEK